MNRYSLSLATILPHGHTARPLDPWEEMQRRGAREQAKGLNDPDDGRYTHMAP